MAHCNKLFKYDQKTFFATSMLVMDFGDEMCWWQFKDIGDCFGHFGHQHSLSHERWAPTSKRCHQDLNSVANILKLSPAASHQHDCSPFSPLRNNLSLDNFNCSGISNLHYKICLLLLFDAWYLWSLFWNYCRSTWNSCCKYQTIIDNEMPLEGSHCIGKSKFKYRLNSDSYQNFRSQS